MDNPALDLSPGNTDADQQLRDIDQISKLIGDYVLLKHALSSLRPRYGLPKVQSTDLGYFLLETNNAIATAVLPPELKEAYDQITTQEDLDAFFDNTRPPAK